MQREEDYHQQQASPRRSSSGSSSASERIAAPKKRSLLMPRSKSRSSSFQGLTVHLSGLMMKTILGRISPYCDGGEERGVCDHLLSSLKRDQLLSRGGGADSGVMEDMLFFLIGKLSSQDVPSNLVADIHSCIGLIQDHMGHPQQAIRSLMSALWIQQKMMTTLTTTTTNASVSQSQQQAVVLSSKKKLDHDELTVNIALTEQRLGMLYGQVGDYESSVSLLQKAYDAYGQSKMKSDHTVYVQAEESLVEFRARLEHEEEQKLRSSFTRISLRRSGIAEQKVARSLSGIVEEGSSCQLSSSTSTPPNEVFVRAA